jgi:hypothetical protein
METGQNRQQLLRRGGPAARCTTLVAGASFDGSHTRHRLNSSRADRTGRDVHQILHELQAQVRVMPGHACGNSRANTLFVDRGRERQLQQAAHVCVPCV